jgi:hypothetical protein
MCQASAWAPRCARYITSQLNMLVLAFNMPPAVVQLTTEACVAAMYAVMHIATCLHVADECGPEGMLVHTGSIDAS